jgi:membrane fusion protein (multidrug efflux system)
LARIEAISQSDLDQYTSALAAAEASVRSAEQALRNASLNVGYTRIMAPIDGIASACKAHAGDYVGPGTRFEVLATLSNNDSLSAVISLPTREYLSLAEGLESYENRNLLREIRLYLSDGSAYPYPGSYDYTLKDIAQGEGVIQLSLLFPNPEGRLKAGAFARIRAQIGEAHPVVLVPQRAVSQTQGVNAVWVIREDSSVEYRPVELGPTYDSLWSIRQGVQAGERVVTGGLLKLHQGEQVSF